MAAIGSPESFKKIIKSMLEELDLENKEKLAEDSNE